MKKYIIALIILIGLIPAKSYGWFDKPTYDDYILQTGFIGLIIIDTLQTNYFLSLPPYYKNGYEYKHTEGNPILESNPSKRKVYTYNGLVILTHTFIAFALKKPYRNVFQFIGIDVQVITVHHNYKAVGSFKLKF